MMSVMWVGSGRARHRRVPSTRPGGAIAGLALLLGGCSFAPAYQRPAAPVAPVFAAAQPPGPSIAGIGWHDFFTDPELRAVIETALANNRDLRVAVGRIAEARAQYRIQAAALLPAVDGVAGGTRSHVPADLSVTG